MLTTILYIIAIPLFGAGTTAEPFAPESLGLAVRDMIYLHAQPSTYSYLNGIYHLALPLLLVPGVMATYLALKEADRRPVRNASILAGLSMVISLALAQVGYWLVNLSNSYMATTDTAQQASIAASADVAIRILGVGEVVSGFLLFGWILVTSRVASSQGLVSSRVMYLGYFGAFGGPFLGALTILFTVVVQSWSAFYFAYPIFTPFFFIWFIWFPVFGLKLFRLG